MKRIATTISIAGIVASACDVADDRSTVREAELAVDEAPLAESDSEDDAPDEPSRSLVSDQAEDDEPASELPLQAKPHVLEAPTCGAFPSTAWGGACEWVKDVRTSGTDARADCSSGVGASYFALSGGCWTGTSGVLKFNHPDEGSIGDMPEDGATNSADGWTCRYDTNADATHTHRAVALCCPGVIVATCP